MSAVIQAKKSKKPTQSKSKATFNRLRKNIETLERNLKTVYREWDECLAHYHSTIEPTKNKLAAVTTEIVKIVYDHYKNAKRVSKKERDILKDFILDKIHDILNSIPGTQPDPEVKEILKDLEGFDFDELVSDQLSQFKDELAEMLKAQGVDIDLSNINDNDDQDEVMRKLMETIFAAKEQMESNFSEKPKTKKQIEKELKEKKLETLQKQGLSRIYKQLAKAFHPDLEQDPVQKIEKEKLMKELTAAYDNKDLHALLKLELDWMNQTESDCKREQTEDQLALYNSLLKDQIRDLEDEIFSIREHPKYCSIQKFMNFFPSETMFSLNALNNEFKKTIKFLTSNLNELKTGDRAKVIRQIIQAYN